MDEKPNDLEIARRWIASSYLGFVGRHDEKRFSIDHSERNYRAKKWGKLPGQIESMSIALRKASIENLDALEFINKYTQKRNNLLILDPPYVGTESYYSDKFTAHQQLAEILQEVAAAGVLATYYDVPEVRKLYPETRWEWHIFDRTKSTGYSPQNPKEKPSEVILKRKEKLTVAMPQTKREQEKMTPPATTKRAEQILGIVKAELAELPLNEFDRLIELLHAARLNRLANL